MSSVDVANATFVRRIRIRASGSGATAVARGVAALTAQADLECSLPHPSAILCVRRLADPKPRALGLGSRGLRPASVWETAARAALARTAASAARPAHGPVPTSADAVLFLDRAELLACLAADWCAGTASARWWWRALLGSVQPEAILRLWRQAPTHVPAAFDLLHSSSRLVEFVSRLSPDAVHALTADVARTCGLPYVASAMAASVSRADGAAELPEAVRGPSGRVPSAPNRETMPLRGFLRQDAPLVRLAALTPGQRLLTIAALVAYRRASVATRILGPAAVRLLLSGDDGAFGSADAAPRVASSSRPEGDRVSGGLDQRHHDAAECAGPSVSASEVPPAAEGSVTAQPPRVPPPHVTTPRAIAPGRVVAQTVDTALGGTFYLINVAIHLGLYPDFTRPSDPSLALPVWDLLQLAAERLIPHAELCDDALVPLLARLSGREPDEPPGAAFVPPHAETVATWCRRATARLVARLARGLAMGPAEAVALTLRRPARVSVSAAHVNVAFQIDDLPIAIRLAGLDRDPGFVPAAGRTVTYSYA